MRDEPRVKNAESKRKDFADKEEEKKSKGEGSRAVDTQNAGSHCPETATPRHPTTTDEIRGISEQRKNEEERSPHNNSILSSGSFV